MTDLHRTYKALLVELFQCGGSGHLDIHGRIVAGSPQRLMPDDKAGWIRLVAAGMIAGEDDKIILTSAGRAMAMSNIETVRDSA